LAEIKKQGRNPLCIIGTAGTAGNAPYDMEIDGEYVYDIWAINTAIIFPEVKRVDRVYEMHPKRYWGQLPVTERLCNFNGPVYMQDHYKEIPNSVKYPLKKIKDKYHLDVMGDNLYVTNTITWMILHALEEGYTDLNLYGVHMSHETEYAYQRSSCSWVLGIIHGWILDGKPYKLTIPQESQLLKASYEYGFDEPTKMMDYVNGRIEGLENGAKQAREEMENLKRSLFRNEGAISEARHYLKRVSGRD
jgi:hypothetical protein